MVEWENEDLDTHPASAAENEILIFKIKPDKKRAGTLRKSNFLSRLSLFLFLACVQISAIHLGPQILRPP
jgi:hypothetical protein